MSFPQKLKSQITIRALTAVSAQGVKSYLDWSTVTGIRPTLLQAYQQPMTLSYALGEDTTYLICTVSEQQAKALKPGMAEVQVVFTQDGWERHTNIIADDVDRILEEVQSNA